MRYIPSMCMREGMFLGKSIYGRDGELLLRQGQIIHNSYINKIISLGFQGVYIIDDISKDIEIQNVVSDDVRIEAVRAVKSVFVNPEKIHENGSELDMTKKLVENIVDEIFKNSNLMVNMIDLKVFDEYTFYHCVNVAVMSIAIASHLSFTRTELCKLGLSAILHDVGKVFISKDILGKTGRLTKEEFDSIKEHSALGFDYLNRRFDLPRDSKLGVLEHHEKYDGTGYPNRLTGKDISLFGRIIAVADVYDALTSDRPYRKAVLPSEAMEYVMGGSGSLFDPQVVLQFSRKVAAFPVGTCVKLSNGMIGIVVENFKDCCMRPKVRIVRPELGEPNEINLRDDPSARNITIAEIARI